EICIARVQRRHVRGSFPSNLRVLLIRQAMESAVERLNLHIVFTLTTCETAQRRSVPKTNIDDAPRLLRAEGPTWTIRGRPHSHLRSRIKKHLFDLADC